jgi:hypothetical protein
VRFLTTYSMKDQIKQREWQKKYRQSEKGKLVAKKALAKYKNSDRGKLLQKKYSDNWKRSIPGLFSTGVMAAKVRNLVWTITIEQYTELRNKKCLYCSNDLPIKGVGLDRLDNSNGYTIENVVPCCGSCNIIRGANLSHEEMIVAMKAVIAYRSNK